MSQQQAGGGLADAGPAPAGGVPGIVSAWRALAVRHAAVSAVLERELGERHGLGVSECEVLELMASVLETVRVPESCTAVRSTLTRD